MRHIGRINWFGGENNQTGRTNNFGFIERLEGQDIYVHREDLTFSFFSDAQYEGKIVTFDIETKFVRDVKKDRAVSVKLLSNEKDQGVLISAFYSVDDRFFQPATDVLLQILTGDEVLNLIRTKIKKFSYSAQSRLRIKAVDKLATFLLTSSAKDIREVLAFDTLLNLFVVVEKVDDWANEINQCFQNVSTQQWNKFCESIESKLSSTSQLINLIPNDVQKRIFDREPNIEIIKKHYFSPDPNISSPAADRLYTTLPDQEILEMISRRMAISEGKPTILLPKDHRKKISLLLLSEQGKHLRQRLDSSVRLGLYTYAQPLSAFTLEILECKKDVTQDQWATFCETVREGIEYGSDLYQSVPDSIKGNIVRLKFAQIFDLLAACSEFTSARISWTADWLYGHLSDIDRTLAETWGKSEKDNDYHKAKMLSARGAEKVAYWFYRSLKMYVQDISVTQLNKSSEDWKTHDLLVNRKIGVDVKNARTPVSYLKDRKRRYVEHWVPKFKEYRRTKEVKIAGVISPYILYNSLEHPDKIGEETDPITFLGETTWSEIQQLEQRFNKNHLVISINGIHFVPAWLFEYPYPFYAERDQNQKRLKNQLRKYQLPSPRELEMAQVNPFPACLAARLTKHDITPWFETLNGWQKSFYVRLCNSTAENISLPFLFLVLLTHFLEMLIDKRNWDEYHPEGYNRLIYAKPSDTHLPLGIIDPLEIITNFIDTLCILWDNKESCHLGEYSSFRFNGTGLLEGMRPEDHTRVTILAYCGGFLKGKGSCGKSPLIIGKEQTCTCGKLICPDCDYCSESCPDRAKRASQKAMADKQELVEETVDDFTN